MLHLSDNLKLIRQLSELSQQEFGKLFGISKDKVFSYENERAQPNELIAAKIAEFAGITEEQLYKKKLKREDVIIKPQDDNGYKIKRPDIELHGSLIRIESMSKVIINTLAQLLAKESGEPVAAVISSLAKAVQDEIEVRKKESQ
jgi:transcriptional regulator with XRE-family HTH domain